MQNEKKLKIISQKILEIFWRDPSKARRELIDTWKLFSKTIFGRETARIIGSFDEAMSI
jgi:hypothetical protein